MVHNYTESTRVADIVLANKDQMLLLEHLGIELVVKSRTVKEVCLENHMCTDLFLSMVKLYDGGQIEELPEFHQNDIDAIILYLRNCHNYYLNEKVPKIREYVNRILKENPSLKMLQDFTDGYIQEITEHFAYENNIVFPYVKALAENSAASKIYSVTEYKQHHSNIDDKLTDLQELILKYLPFQDTTHLRRKIFFCLTELEYDLKIHSSIEDNILIPLVENLEKTNKGSESAANADDDKSADVILSAREIDVLKCMVQGLQSKEIAEKLFISTNTVITHRKNITEKTGIKSLAGLTIYAILHNLININDVKELN